MNPRRAVHALVFSSLCFALGCNSSDGTSSQGTTTPPPSPTKHGDGGSHIPPKGWNAAVGAAGTFAQTFDGTTWQSRTLGSEDLWAVSCVSDTLGWAAGGGGLVVRTQDAGQTWTRLPTATTATLRALRFAGPLGLAAGDRGTLLLSRDSGDTWAPVPSGTTATLRGVAIARSGLLLAVGDGGTLLRSADGGTTWAPAVATGAADLRAVATTFDGGLTVAADAAGGVWESTDAGLHFHRAAAAPAGLWTISLLDSGQALAAGAQGTALLRDPAGAWRPLATSVTTTLRAALVTAEGDRYDLAGEGGTLLTSTDGGSTWQRLSLPTGAAIYGMEDF